jgi:hypothetical protein
VKYTCVCTLPPPCGGAPRRTGVPSPAAILPPSPVLIPARRRCRRRRRAKPVWRGGGGGSPRSPAWFRSGSDRSGHLRHCCRRRWRPGPLGDLRRRTAMAAGRRARSEPIWAWSGWVYLHLWRPCWLSAVLLGLICSMRKLGRWRSPLSSEGIGQFCGYFGGSRDPSSSPQRRDVAAGENRP